MDELDSEVTHRVQSGWRNWKRVSGVLCDRHMNVMYGAEAWELKMALENKLEVAEMRMLRWICGVTKLYNMRSEIISGTTKVREITNKVQERRLKWYGNVMRSDERAMEMKAQGGRESEGLREDGWIE